MNTTNAPLSFCNSVSVPSGIVNHSLKLGKLLIYAAVKLVDFHVVRAGREKLDRDISGEAALK
jgi:hypothetical protein